MKNRLRVLQESPFFDQIDADHLEFLAAHSQLETFVADEPILEEGAAANRFYVLVQGSVRLSFRRSTSEKTPAQAGLNNQLAVRTISEPGRTIGWSSMVAPFRYRASAVACEATQLLSLERATLERYCEEHPRFGVLLMKRILWVLGNRLRATRIRFVAQRYDAELAAIRSLLDQSAELLSVTSPLHRLPHYLENRLTLVDAFHVLETVQVHGDEAERNLAALCLEILANVKAERVGILL